MTAANVQHGKKENPLDLIELYRVENGKVVAFESARKTVDNWVNWHGAFRTKEEAEAKLKAEKEAAELQEKRAAAKAKIEADKKAAEDKPKPPRNVPSTAPKE